MTTSHASHPRALWILALTEMCERFAFWGVGNLLVLFLIESYHLPDEKATQIYGVFTGFAAFLPLFGGWLADRWNYQSPIFLGAIVNAIGCFALSTAIPSLLFPSLFIIACGYGIFTPSILTVLGHIYRDLPTLRESGFSIYYASINVGVFLAMASLGIIAKYFGWHAAFFTAGSVQVIGIVPFLVYMRHHKEVIHSLKAVQEKAHEEKKPLSSQEKDRWIVIVAFYFVSILFWMAYNQGFSSMEVFVHQFMNQWVGSWQVPEGLFLSSESFFLILLAPLLTILYRWLQTKRKDPSPALKTSFSLFSMAICFAIMMGGSFQIPPNAMSAQVSSGYLIGAYFFMAIGEMLLAPIGLSMVSRLAPKQSTALAIGCWYVSVGLAFFLGGFLASFMENFGGLSYFFALFVAISLIASILFFFISKKLTRMSHLDHI